MHISFIRRRKPEIMQIPFRLQLAMFRLYNIKNRLNYYKNTKACFYSFVLSHFHNGLAWWWLCVEWVESAFGFIITMPTAQFTSSHFICIRIHQIFSCFYTWRHECVRGSASKSYYMFLRFGTKHRTVATIILTAYSLLLISDTRVFGASHAITEPGKLADSVVVRHECNGATFI